MTKRRFVGLAVRLFSDIENSKENKFIQLKEILVRNKFTTADLIARFERDNYDEGNYNLLKDIMGNFIVQSFDPYLRVRVFDIACELAVQYASRK